MISSCDTALAIGLIWALGSLLYFLCCNEKTGYLIANILTCVLINLSATVVFSVAYMVSYLIARGIG